MCSSHAAISVICISDMKTINFAIIEDTADIRENLYDYLQSVPGFNCVICSDSMEAFLENGDYDELPDVVLSDIGFSGMSGIEGIPHVKRKFPDTNIILFTVFNESDKVFKALCAGAAGYILKGAPLSEIKDAVIAIANGGSYMSPSIARKVINYFTPTVIYTEKLSERETEIVKALADGLSYKLIADKLALSVDAIRYHIKSVYKKLQVNSKAEVIRKVFRGEI